MDVVRAPKIRIVESLIEECESLGLLENGKLLAYVIYIPKMVKGGLALERIKDILNEDFRRNA
jgi:hypothetical protein